MGSLPFALQLYTVRDKMDEDAPGTLKRVKEIGYDNVELAGTAGMSMAEFRQVLDDLGLNPVCTHVGYDDVTQTVEKTIDDLNTLGVSFVCVPGISGDLTADKEGWINVGKGMDAGGAKLREAGFTLCYHNHAHEFEQYDGEYIFDIFYGASSPENVQCQQDTYWVQYGGQDPVAYIKKYSGRVPLLHVKDMTPGEDRAFAEMGAGILDWPAIFAAAKDAGVQWYIVEQDTCPGDSLKSAAISAEFMARQ
jgi:sugar phosphate isomerase/epimerase